MMVNIDNDDYDYDDDDNSDDDDDDKDDDDIDDNDDDDDDDDDDKDDDDEFYSIYYIRSCKNFLVKCKLNVFEPFSSSSELDLCNTYF